MRELAKRNGMLIERQFNRFVHTCALDRNRGFGSAPPPQKRAGRAAGVASVMGSTGAVIMGFFGAVLCIAGLAPLIGWTNPLLLVPIAIFASIVTRAVALSRKGTGKARTARAGKVIVWSSIGEGIGIFIVLNVLQNVGHANLILPGIVAVVGLHFLPIAYAIPFRSFYVVAAALLLTAALGILLRQPIGSALAGTAAAAVLWIASFSALQRESGSLKSHG